MSVHFFCDYFKVINRVNFEILTGRNYNSLYVFKLKYLNVNENLVANLSNVDNEINVNVRKSLWHNRLGHLNEKYLNQLKDEKLIDFNVNEKDQFCGDCCFGKQSRLPHKSPSTANTVLELVHSDICGPMPVVTYNQKKYFLTFIDHFSKFVTVYLLENKSQVPVVFKAYHAEVKNRFNKNIVSLRCDNGTEYVNAELINFCTENGLVLQRTITYCPQMNGTAERMNRTIMEKA